MAAESNTAGGVCVEGWESWTVPGLMCLMREHHFQDVQLRIGNKDESNPREFRTVVYEFVGVSRGLIGRNKLILSMQSGTVLLMP